MGEFQCYKFRTISRSLSPVEQQEVDALSSRGHVTNTSATFIYHYSDFRHGIENVLAKYFDIALYFANWGTRQLIFRLPKKLINKSDLEPYLHNGEWGSHIKLSSKGDYYLLDLYFNEEGGGGWGDEEDYNISNFESIYHDLLNGDYRSLYLLWVNLQQQEIYEKEEDYDEEEDSLVVAPDIPHNLGQLSASLQEFITFFEIDDDIVTAVQSFSPKQDVEDINYENLLQQLPNTELVDWLSRLLKGEARLEIMLRKHLERMVSSTTQKPATTKVSVSQILERTALIEREQKAAAAAAKHATHVLKMQKLAKQEERLWKDVQFNIDLKNSKGYDIATSTLKELKAVAEYQNKSTAFNAKMQELRPQYSRLSSLISRWKAAGLIED